MISNPGKIVGAMVYVDGNVLDATAEVTLPNIAFLTEDVDSMGSNGPTEMILPKLDKMEVEIQAMAPGVNLGATISPFNDVVVEGRGSWQVELPDGGSGTTFDRVNMICRQKGLNFGAQSNADGGERTPVYVVHALTYYIEGDEVFHWAGFSKNELRINGVDYIAQHRSNLGLT
jgi:P2 family phage contractile tail tube protein